MRIPQLIMNYTTSLESCKANNDPLWRLVSCSLRVPDGEQYPQVEPDGEYGRTTDIIWAIMYGIKAATASGSY